MDMATCFLATGAEETDRPVIWRLMGTVEVEEEPVGCARRGRVVVEVEGVGPSLVRVYCALAQVSSALRSSSSPLD